MGGWNAVLQPLFEQGIGALMADEVRSAKDILASVKSPREIMLDTAALSKGIDNYHIDVELGPEFILHARHVIEDMVKRVVAGKKPGANAQDMDALRTDYKNLVTGTLHRTKTDLKPAQVRVLHFGVMKFVLEEVGRQLDEVVKQLEDSLAQQQYSGSRSLLVTQEKFSWMRQNYPLFRYRVARAIMRHIQKEENGQLRPLRGQFLGDDFEELPNVLFNPMLAATTPIDPHLLMDNYAFWPNGGKEMQVTNEKIEALITKRLSALKIEALKAADKLQSGQAEVYDALGGLFAVQPFLGPSPDQKDKVGESFCWLEHPGNIRLLFDADVHQRFLDDIDGMRAQWSFKSDIKKLEKIGVELRNAVMSDDDFRVMVSGYVVRSDWQPAWDDILDIGSALLCAAGRDTRKILSRVDQSKEGSQALIQQMESWQKEVTRAVKEDEEELALRILTDLARFRLHLKYYRFAHRMFNRIKVITAPEEIQLSKANGHLYQLAGDADDRPDELTEPQIIHHAILKADVRGSTTVTQELIRQGLNPASYFSQRFFGPINQVIGVYGATKVFIEGDAIILAVHEYDKDPGQWYSVSRACGIAKEMLDFVSSGNAQNRQTGLPLLEIGIGICYSDDRPLFLFDEERPIMISPAIGDADRMSSCSWRLRESFESSEFNVAVLEISEDDRQRGEKGQAHVRYNVNGIVLDDAAFNKLKTEISLKRLKINIGDSSETMYVGSFPDTRGKERHLVIRQGLIGLWQGEEVHRGQDESKMFFEVLPNSKLASQVIELVRSQAAKAG
jgi:hypothetical protein